MKKLANLVPWKKKRNPETFGSGIHLPAGNNRFFSDPFFLITDHLSNRSAWRPVSDIRAGEKDITVEAEIPGMDKGNINVSLNGRLLTIKGEKSQENESSGNGIFRKERSYGYFNRTVELPADVDESSATAEYKKGVPKVKINKLKGSSGLMIPVSTGNKI